MVSIRGARLACAIVVVAVPAGAQTITDGDTLRINGQAVRLYGIDAPELKQRCGAWPAGELAHEALSSMVVDREVTCEGKGHDRYGRLLAVCKVGSLDLGAELVRSGMAWAFTRYSVMYADQEAEARAGNRGVHQHECVPAWEWRVGRERKR